MHIGLDFDNTLVNYDSLFSKVALEKKIIPEGINRNKIEIRNYLKKINKEDLWTALQGEVYGGRILEATPYIGMKKSLQILTALKIQLSIVSHKTKNPFLGARWNLHDAARSWLETHNMHTELGPNILREKVFFEQTKKEKCSRILSIGCTHYIDDLPEILEMLPDSITKIHFDPIGFQTENNRLIVMRSWNELPKILGI